MTTADLREALLVGGLILILVLAAMVLLRPKVATPFIGPLEEQLSNMRHRVANMEQQVLILPGHELRLRAVEHEIGLVRADLMAIKSGLFRNERMLEMLVAYQIEGDKKAGVT